MSFIEDTELATPCLKNQIPYMFYLIKLFPEITIKSRVVRRRFTRQLRKNLYKVLRELDHGIQVRSEWDAFEVESNLSNVTKIVQLEEKFRCVPGVGQVYKVDKYPLPSMEEMFQFAKKVYFDSIKGKTFAVRCKRMGKHPFTSVDVERYVGGRVNEECETAGVKLKNPDITISLEIRDEYFYIVRKKISGLGGFPLGCQDSVLSLISGGFDSSVSSYLSIKRGLQTHYCFFNLGGKAHELAVKEIALFLWLKFHSSHRVKFILVPFESVLEEILKKVENSYRGVILKRMMLRAANRVGAKLGLEAIVTGESIAQVSSQTLANLSVIDEVSNSLVLRPLCTTDKQEIINIARQIGTEEFSKNVPEYCAAISKNPSTKAKSVRIEKEESRLDMEVLEKAIQDTRYELITEISQDLTQEITEVEVVHSAKKGDIVIDIRHPSEQKVTPLSLKEGIKIINIPFYKLRSTMQELESDQYYLLYCEKGMMSRLQAAYLNDDGHRNIAVLELRDEET